MNFPVSEHSCRLILSSTDQTPFAVRDVYSRAAQLGYIGGKNHYHFYWEKRNPNEPQRRTGKK